MMPWCSAFYDLWIRVVQHIISSNSVNKSAGSAYEYYGKTLDSLFCHVWFPDSSICLFRWEKEQGQLEGHVLPQIRQVQFCALYDLWIRHGVVQYRLRIMIGSPSVNHWAGSPIEYGSTSYALFCHVWFSDSSSIQVLPLQERTRTKTWRTMQCIEEKEKVISLTSSESSLSVVWVRVHATAKKAKRRARHGKPVAKKSAPNKKRWIRSAK